MDMNGDVSIMFDETELKSQIESVLAPARNRSHVEMRSKIQCDDEEYDDIGSMSDDSSSAAGQASRGAQPRSSSPPKQTQSLAPTPGLQSKLIGCAKRGKFVFNPKEHPFSNYLGSFREFTKNIKFVPQDSFDTVMQTAFALFIIHKVLGKPAELSLVIAKTSVWLKGAKSGLNSKQQAEVDDFMKLLDA